MKNNIDWNTRAARLVCLCAYGALAYLGIKYFLPVAFPFICAVGVAWIISSAGEGLERKTGIPRGVWAFFIVSLLVAAVAFILFFVLRALLSEIGELLGSMKVGNDILQNVFSRFEDLGIFRYAKEELEPVAEQLLTKLSVGISGVLSAALKGTPRAVASGFVLLMCVYYMSVDFDTVKGFFKKLLPKTLLPRAGEYKQTVVDAAAKYIKANVLLFCLTFFEVLVGLLIICPSYALIGALFVAAVDILPVFGAGAVLIPWSIVELACGDIPRGVGLLVLYVAVSIVRRITEPRIIGRTMGMHPLAALICMYAGYRFFGVTGLLSAPFFASLAVNIIKNRE